MRISNSLIKVQAFWYLSIIRLELIEILRIEVARDCRRHHCIFESFSVEFRCEAFNFLLMDLLVILFYHFLSMQLTRLVDVVSASGPGLARIISQLSLVSHICRI